MCQRQQEQDHYTPPTNDQLREYALDAIKQHRGEYRRLQKSGELEGEISERVAACKERAEEMVRSGTFAGQAWRWAIREAIIGINQD